MSKRVLVTGVSGFVGGHLARELRLSGHLVLGTDMSSTLRSEVAPNVTQYFGGRDLTNPSHVATLPLDDIDAVINLAGLAQVGASFGDGDVQERYDRINVGVHTVIADRLIERGRQNTRLVAVSTGAVYDNHGMMPVTEDTPFAQNASPYAKSKIAMERAMAEYRNKGLDIVVARPMNHIGPGQLGGFLVPDMIEKLRGLGPDKTLRMGRLDTKRDYTDVRDVVRAYVLLATQETLGYDVYNVCSGVSHSGQEILDVLSRGLGIDYVRTELDQARVRPVGTDPLDIYGEASRLRHDTGWQPLISFEQTLLDCL